MAATKTQEGVDAICDDALGTLRAAAALTDPAEPLVIFGAQLAAMIAWIAETTGMDTATATAVVAANVLRTCELIAAGPKKHG